MAKRTEKKIKMGLERGGQYAEVAQKRAISIVTAKKARHEEVSGFLRRTVVDAMPAAPIVESVTTEAPAAEKLDKHPF